MHRRSDRRKVISEGRLNGSCALFACALLVQLSAYLDCRAQLGYAAQWPKITYDIAVSDASVAITAGDIHVVEDGIEQPDVVMLRDDEPVSVCLLLDLSSSMKTASAPTVDAMRQLVAGLRPEDEIEIVGFNLSPFALQRFTTNRGQIDAVASSLKFQGGSAFYDALNVSVDQLMAHPPKFRSVVIIISDGDDNYSHIAFPAMMRGLMAPNAPTIYSLCPPQDSEQGFNYLERLAKVTGGIASRPSQLSLLPEEAKRIALDIHNRYRLHYTSTHTKTDGKLHKVEVKYQPNMGVSKAKTVFKQEYYAPLH